MGSLVGGFASFVTTYANQRHQYRRDFLSKQFAQRETLYSEFINEAARLSIESLDRQMEKASGLGDDRRRWPTNDRSSSDQYLS